MASRRCPSLQDLDGRSDLSLRVQMMGTKGRTFARISKGKFFFVLLLLWCFVAVVVFNLRVVLELNSETTWTDSVLHRMPSKPTGKAEQKSHRKISSLAGSGKRVDPFVDPSRGFNNFVQTMIKSYLEKDGSSKRSQKLIIYTTDPAVNANSTAMSSKVSRYRPSYSKKCECDLLSVDCLDSIPCMPTNPEFIHALVLLGIETRRVIKQTATFEGAVDETPFNPIGKQLQYSSISAWHSWREFGILPKSYHPKMPSDFVDPTRYRYCRERNRKGKSCFFGSVSGDENSAGSMIEKKAVRWIETKYNSSEEVMNARGHVRRMMGVFVEQQMPNSDRTNTVRMSPLGHLMMFAHICRLLFNRRSFMEDIFRAHLVTLETGRKISGSSELGAFTLSIHIRRGDSCSIKDPEQYEAKAGALDSPAQTSNVRKCYQTKVYMDAVQRVRRFLPDDRPMNVFLSTDDAEDVMEDIKMRHADVFFSVDQWNYLNYSRTHFQYEQEFIEDTENKERPILGETAVADLWLLSQGQTFVGHFGSRFGKVAWLLATSRQARFVPYLSVDGHSKYCLLLVSFSS
jgi:hypothetical protein